MTIEVSLPKNRLQLGTLTTGEFTCKCYGKSDNFAATKAGNPTHDPAKPFGDTPAGTYSVIEEPAGTGSGALRSYGPNKRLLLLDVPGRTGIMIHGGAPGNGGGLRPTDGCLRLSNDDMVSLLAIFTAPCTITIKEL